MALSEEILISVFHRAQLLTCSSACTEKQKDAFADFALGSRLTTKSLEMKTRTTHVPALLQDAADHLIRIVKLRAKSTCVSAIVHRGAYFSGSIPSQVHPRSYGVSPGDLSKRNINVLDKPDDLLLSTTPDTPICEGVE